MCYVLNPVTTRKFFFPFFSSKLVEFNQQTKRIYMFLKYVYPINLICNEKFCCIICIIIRTKKDVEINKKKTIRIIIIFQLFIELQYFLKIRFYIFCLFVCLTSSIWIYLHFNFFFYNNSLCVFFFFFTKYIMLIFKFSTLRLN